MLWTDDDQQKGFEVDDSVVDIIFSIECRELPVDHTHSLSNAIKEALPGHGDETGLGINPIYLAGSQNGWERPDESLGQNLILSKRTKLTLRVRKEHQDEVIEKLQDKTLMIDGFPLTIRKPKIKKLSKEGTIFSRSIVCSDAEAEDEMLFLQRMQKELNEMGIPIKKALCGKLQPIKTPQGPLLTRSLMLAELQPEHSVKLQQHGIGDKREMGCGIFIPHKGIKAVGESTDDE